MDIQTVRAKLNSLKDKVLDFVDAVKADPKKQLLVVFVVGFVGGFAVRSL